MAYVIQASPISKIFVPEWHKKCLEDHKLVLDDRIKFDITIPRSAGSITLTHNVPKHASSLIPNTTRREIDTDEVRNLLPWLTGGADAVETDTDIYGVVLLKLDRDMTQGITELVSVEAIAMEGEKAAEEYMKKQQEMLRAMINQMKNAVTLAKAVADERVKRAMRITHSNLKVEWGRIEQAGGRVFDPSIAEALGALVLQTEIEAQSHDQAKVHGILNKAIRNVRAH
jgi:hypothetical protein